MKKHPLRVLALVAILLGIAALGYGGYRFTRARATDLRISELTSDGAPPESIEGLKEAIARYEGRIEEQTKTAAQAGIYWKLLATRYIDRKMYGEALDALKRAVEYFPEDSTLYYMTGLSASVMAKSALDFSRTGSTAERNRLFALAESSHKRAIALDPKNTRSLYALGVLYVFELDRAADAIPYLERYLLLESKDVDAMFILARAFYVTGKRDDAVNLYDRIIATTKDKNKKAEAEANKKTVLDELYVSR